MSGALTRRSRRWLATRDAQRASPTTPRDRITRLLQASRREVAAILATHDRALRHTLLADLDQLLTTLQRPPVHAAVIDSLDPAEGRTDHGRTP